MFVLRVLCFIVCWCWCWQTKGVCVVSTFCQNGRLLVEFFFSEHKKKKLRKTKDDERAPPPPLLLSPFFFLLLYHGWMGVCRRSSSFVVVLSQNTACSHVLVCVSSLPPFDASTGFTARYQTWTRRRLSLPCLTVTAGKKWLCTREGTFRRF